MKVNNPKNANIMVKIAIFSAIMIFLIGLYARYRFSIAKFFKKHKKSKI